MIKIFFSELDAFFPRVYEIFQSFIEANLGLLTLIFVLALIVGFFSKNENVRFFLEAVSILTVSFIFYFSPESRTILLTVWFFVLHFKLIIRILDSILLAKIQKALEAEENKKNDDE